MVMSKILDIDSNMIKDVTPVRSTFLTVKFNLITLFFLSITVKFLVKHLQSIDTKFLLQRETINSYHLVLGTGNLNHSDDSSSFLQEAEAVLLDWLSSVPNSSQQGRLNGGQDSEQDGAPSKSLQEAEAALLDWLNNATDSNEHGGQNGGKDGRQQDKPSKSLQEAEADVLD